MALSGRVVCSIYSFNGSNVTRAGLSGITNSFPSAETMFYALQPGVTANNVVMNSAVVLLPTGLNQVGKTYYTDSTVAQLQTNGF